MQQAPGTFRRIVIGFIHLCLLNAAATAYGQRQGATPPAHPCSVRDAAGAATAPPKSAPDSSEQAKKRVLIMDTCWPDEIYDAASRAEGKNNADEVRNVLSPFKDQLAVDIELVTEGWAKDNVIREQSPDLVIMHAGAFYKTVEPRHEQRRLEQFLKMASGSKTQFLIFSRGMKHGTVEGRKQILDYLGTRIPALRGRVHLFEYTAGQRLTFRNGVVGEDLRRQVKRILALK